MLNVLNPKSKHYDDIKNEKDILVWHSCTDEQPDSDSVPVYIIYGKKNIKLCAGYYDPVTKIWNSMDRKVIWQAIGHPLYWAVMPEKHNSTYRQADADGEDIW